MASSPEPIDKQMRTLRLMGAVPRRSLVFGILVLSAPFVLFTFYIRAGLWVVSVFFLFVTTFALISHRHTRQAALGLDAETRTEGWVQFERDDEWSDSYNTSVRDLSGSRWKFSSEVLGWKPREAQDYPAKLCFIAGIKWPVLVITEHALLYPTMQPTVE